MQKLPHQFEEGRMGQELTDHDMNYLRRKEEEVLLL